MKPLPGSDSYPSARLSVPAPAGGRVLPLSFSDPSHRSLDSHLDLCHLLGVVPSCSMRALLHESFPTLLDLRRTARRRRLYVHTQHAGAGSTSAHSTQAPARLTGVPLRCWLTTCATHLPLLLTQELERLCEASEVDALFWEVLLPAFIAPLLRGQQTTCPQPQIKAWVTRKPTESEREATIMAKGMAMQPDVQLHSAVDLSRAACAASMQSRQEGTHQRGEDLDAASSVRVLIELARAAVNGRQCCRSACDDRRCGGRIGVIRSRIRCFRSRLHTCVLSQHHLGPSAQRRAAGGAGGGAPGN